MNYRSANAAPACPETLVLTYRSEAFAEDLDDIAPPAAGWHPLERLVAALPLLCIFAPVADAYLRS